MIVGLSLCQPSDCSRARRTLSSAAALIGTLCATACGPSEGELWRAQEDAIQAHYEKEYRQWSAKDAEAIVARLLALRAPYFSTRSPSNLQPIEEPTTRTGDDPTLLMLLGQTDTMAARDLQAPRRLPADRESTGF
jgi:hypothetical protein